MESVEKVVTCLHERPMTMRHLVAETGLARRTIYAIVQKLRAGGGLREQVSLKDARQTWFWLPDATRRA